MNDPATESQLNIIRQFHYEPDHPLTRLEAAQIIGNLRRHKDPRAAPGIIHSVTQPPASDPHRLRLLVGNARQAVASALPSHLAECELVLANAIQKRQDFWLNTCREPLQMQSHSEQVWGLYMKHGCRFVEPTREQVQEVLDALDSALRDWDQDHPELFYQTLELNFPGLIRHI